jgi:hypothetical protein
MFAAAAPMPDSDSCGAFSYAMTVSLTWRYCLQAFPTRTRSRGPSHAPQIARARSTPSRSGMAAASSLEGAYPRRRLATAGSGLPLARRRMTSLQLSPGCARLSQRPSRVEPAQDEPGLTPRAGRNAGPRPAYTVACCGVSLGALRRPVSSFRVSLSSSASRPPAWAGYMRSSTMGTGLSPDA